MAICVSRPESTVLRTHVRSQTNYVGNVTKVGRGFGPFFIMDTLQFYAQFLDPIDASLCAQLRDNIFVPILDPLFDQLRDQLYDQLRAQLMSSLRNHYVTC